MRLVSNKKAGNIYTQDIVIWCAGQYGLKILAHIENHDGSVCCFCDTNEEKQGKRIHNIPVYCFEDAYKQNPHALVVVAHSNYEECIRIGDKLQTYGFIKNESYFIALEMEIEGKIPLMKAPICLIDREIILLGPQYLCECFMEWVGERTGKILICTSEEEVGEWKEKYPKAFWIPLYRDALEIGQQEKILRYRQRLSEENVLFTEWFLIHFDYCEKRNIKAAKSCKQRDSVKKVLFNVLINNVGNSFIDGVLDSHPEILYLGLEMYAWSNNIWDIIKNAKKQVGVEIVDRIIEQIQNYTMNAWNKNIDAISVVSLPDKSLTWLEQYRLFLYKRMGEGRQYTEREIFVNMHLAWKEFHDQCVTGNESVIYMDIHGSCVPWETYCMIVRWLENMGFEVVLLQMVRRPYSQSASAMRTYIAQGNFRSDTALAALTVGAYEILHERLCGYPILRLRFEDVKQYPETVLGKLCKELQISWSDSLLETTSAGKLTKLTCANEVVSGYNMKPVWYPYDEFFDAFDKFRLDILCNKKCKAYAYPHVPKEKYVMSAEMLVELFVLPFQFEKYLEFESEQDRIQFRMLVRERCREIIDVQEQSKNGLELFAFGTYLSYVSDDRTEKIN